MERIKIIAITHKRVAIERIGDYHLEQDTAKVVCPQVLEHMAVDELMFLSTCNRVEFVVVTEDEIDNAWLEHFFSLMYPLLCEDKLEDAVLYSEVYEGINAIEHLFSVTSSLDSLVVGEREIITQVRQAFEYSRSIGITGDIIRLLLRKTVETAKEIYTRTHIAAHPVSVVSLAYRQMEQLGIPKNPRVVIVGAGETNTNLARFIKKHGFGNLHIYNRSLKGAQRLADELGGMAHTLDALPLHTGGFDLLFACTSAAEPTVTPDIYAQLRGNETKDRKILVDLGIPPDIDLDVDRHNAVHRIAVATLKPIAERNLREREKEMQLCRAIIHENLKSFKHMFRERQVEISMRKVPGMVKDIRQMAVEQVFRKDIENLDEHSREVLEKVMHYMEKKYISGPMKMAKEILLQKENNS